MKEDHEDGKCYACQEETKVRWKNLYTIGSEGTWLCMECEIFIVQMLRMLASKATKRHIKEIKNAKKNIL